MNTPIVNEMNFILLLILAFYFAIYYNIEKFNNPNYNNTNELSTNFSKFRSCLPYDITYKNDKSNFYDFGNDELNEKFKKVLKINYQKEIKFIEGYEWSNWISTKPPNSSYQFIINNFRGILNNKEFSVNNQHYEIKSHKFNRYKYNLKISIPKKLVFYPFTVRHRLSPSPSINAHHRKNGQKLVINGDGTKS